MKQLILLIVLFLFLFGCKENNNPASKENHSSSGKVAFTFDKVNAPADVKTIETILSRTGFETISKTIDIDADTGAVILFEEVPVGTWHVKVEAKNDDEKVLYKGETNVLVYEATVSQVNLVLSPAETGVGSVLINVTWGSVSVTWKDYQNNPVLIKTGSGIDWGGVGQPKIFYDNGIYRMYYLNYSFPSPVSYAESEDGVHWNRPDSLPIITAGSSGNWDDGGTGPGPVYKIGNIYYMLYQGYDAPTKHFQVGMAKSMDGRHWEKHPTPVFSSSANWENNMMVAAEVEIIDDKFYMYYCSGDKIGLAISTDGISWERYSTSPILVPTQSWENNDISWVSIVQENGMYKMLYTNDDPVSYSGMAFGLAVSIDGKHWEKNSENPIFKKTDAANNWAANGIIYPYIAKVADQLRIYYTGVTLSGEWKIGFAYLK